MTLRVFWHTYTTDESNDTVAYSDYECDNWEVYGNLLVLMDDNGAKAHFPLIHIKTFRELS